MVADLKSAVIKGDTVYFFKVDGKIYKVKASVSDDLPYLEMVKPSKSSRKKTIISRPLKYSNTLRKSLQTTSTLSATSKLCFEQPAASFLVCSLIFIEYKKALFKKYML